MMIKDIQTVMLEGSWFINIPKITPKKVLDN
ncbi:hypothetical protein M973_00410 [Francisella orientalis LADL 07-285A]|nr:hypothetical protein M973_00410 [Francisella orientalis LADL 07-285A]